MCEALDKNSCTNYGEANGKTCVDEFTVATLRNRTDEEGRQLEVARGLGRAREQ